MIPPSFIFPWFDRPQTEAETGSAVRTRKPWLSRGAELNFVVALVAVGVLLGA